MRLRSSCLKSVLSDFSDQGFLIIIIISIIIINTGMLYMQSDIDIHPRSEQHFSHNIANQTQNKHKFYLNLLQPSLYVFILMWLSIMFWNHAALILFWHHAFPSVQRCVILTAVHPAKRWVSQLPRYYLWHDTHSYQASGSPEVPATLSYCMPNGSCCCKIPWNIKT